MRADRQHAAWTAMLHFGQHSGWEWRLLPDRQCDVERRVLSGAGQSA
jgi:hypothetical protein